VRDIISGKTTTYMKRLFIILALVTILGYSADAQRILAHRGGKLEQDENTMEAFKNTLRKGCYAFETDVRITRDGEYVIMHDASLERTTMGTGAIEQTDSEYIRSIKTKKGNKVAFLKEAVEFFNQYDGLYVEFEMKTNEERYPEALLHKYCDDIYKIIMSGKPKNSIYLFTSFDTRPLIYLKDKYKDADVGLITGEPCCKKTVDQCCSLGIKRLAATLDGTTRNDVKYAHDHGVTVNLWPGSIPEDSALAATLGADYLCTDVPEMVMKYIKQHNLPIIFGAVVDGKELHGDDPVNQNNNSTAMASSARDRIFLEERKNTIQSSVAMNPVIPIDCADPSIVKIKDSYYMFVTGFPIRIYKSKNLCDWVFHRNMFPGKTPNDPYGTGELDPMHSGSDKPCYWAPSPALIKGKVVVYLTHFVSLENDRQVAYIADNIDGEFKYAGTLNVGTPEHPTPQDGQFFRDDDGRIYLVWGDVHSNGNFVRELSKDGLSYAKDSKPFYITTEYEGGYIYKHAGRYYFFGSKGYYNNAAYTLCMSTADRLEGPWSPMEPVLESESPDAALNGPGHNGEIFTDRLGRMFMIMHCHCEGLFPTPTVNPNTTTDEIYKARPAILMELKDIDGTLRFVDHHGQPTKHPQWLVKVPAL